MLGSVLLLVVGLVVGRWAPSHFSPIAREGQELETEPQRLAAERQQLTAAKPPEPSRVAGGESAAPKTEPQPRQETQGAVGVPPVTPPVPPPTGKTWQNNIGMEFVLIPAGEFMMGSKNGDDDEKPVHRVRISKAFYLGKYEVTQAQWQAVMGDNPSRFKGDTLPVEQVSWEDVQEFIRRLNTKEGGSKYRLPTEAEWEYAARAGTTTAYSFGDNPRQLGEYAWFSENSGNTTHPIGQKKSNKWGLYDMHGNVWEWVQDWYSNDAYKSSPSTAVDPKGPPAGSYRVYRGGGWINGAVVCRSALRLYDVVGPRHVPLGLRLLREVP